MQKKLDTSWDSVGNWYIDITKDKGHYYQENVIFPKLVKMLFSETKDIEESSVVDCGCGNGVLLEYLPENIEDYLGIDIAESLIKDASKRRGSNFVQWDLREKIKISEGETLFSHAVSNLALQNIDNIPAVLENINCLLQKTGTFVLVLNHPCFRIPRQTHWGVDPATKIRYRRIDSYMSQLDIPIALNPSKGDKSVHTLSFHRPLSYWSNKLFEAGFVTTDMQEWISEKKSTGSAAKQENRSRKEIPMFLAIKAVKIKNL